MKNKNKEIINITPAKTYKELNVKPNKLVEDSWSIRDEIEIRRRIDKGNEFSEDELENMLDMSEMARKLEKIQKLKAFLPQYLECMIWFLLLIVRYRNWQC